MAEYMLVTTADTNPWLLKSESEKKEWYLYFVGCKYVTGHSEVYPK